MRPTKSIAAFILLAARISCAADVQPQAAQPDDLDVSVALDSSGQSGSARATVRIRAHRDVVWDLITSCPVAISVIPGLVACSVLKTAPDQSWQIIRHVMTYSWYLPTVTYEMRASYRRPARVDIERVSGDLRILRGSWDLQSDGEYTVARYAVDLAPGFWVPLWVVHSALRRDLPKMLRALRSRAEAAPAGAH